MKPRIHDVRRDLERQFRQKFELRRHGGDDVLPLVEAQLVVIGCAVGVFAGVVIGNSILLPLAQGGVGVDVRAHPVPGEERGDAVMAPFLQKMAVDMITLRVARSTPVVHFRVGKGRVVPDAGMADFAAVEADKLSVEGFVATAEVDVPARLVEGCRAEARI